MAVNYSSILWFYGFRCLEEGKFCICKDAKTEFVGCCKSDPCVGGKGICPKGNLTQMISSQNLLGGYPPLDCDDPTGNKTWYECKYWVPLFLGCCGVEACDREDGCPTNEAMGATLPVDESLRRKFLEPEIDYESTASSASYPAPEPTQSFKSVDFSNSDWASEITFGPGMTVYSPFLAHEPSQDTPQSGYGGPKRLYSPDITWFLGWIWDLVRTFLPLCFIALAFLAIRLDNQSHSQFGQRVVELTRLTIVSRFYKALARWCLEKPGGIRLAVLEQIFGSQSFVSAFERLFLIRTQAVVGSVILLTWAMSPLGGQSASRLLYNGVTSLESKGTVYYANPAYQMSYWSTDVDERIAAAARPSVEVLYSTSLFSSSEQKGSPRDLWRDPSMATIQNKQWTAQRKPEFYSSLLGINIKGLAGTNLRTHFNFSVQTSYFDINCDLVDTFNPLRDNLTGNQSHLMYQFSQTFASFKIIQDKVDSFYAPYRFQYISLETAILCGPGDPATTCEARRQRRLDSQSAPARLLTPVSLYDAMVMLKDWGGISNEETQYVPCPTDLYIMKGSNPYSGEAAKSLTESDLSVFPSVFSSRITTAFNTFWASTLNPHGHTNVEFETVPEHNVPGFMYNQTTDQPFMNTTIGTRTISLEVYRANTLWIGLLLFTTMLLQILAISGLVLQAFIRGPDVLGFASSMTRDNPSHTSRWLRDVRLELTDVRPEDENGYVALRAVPSVVQVNSEEGGEEDDKPTVSTGLNRKRLYE
ncbi:hypothetical protein BKA56DRAFT_688620 [Ilyonectria sp. MPI-CAGE-AT-0026]|nr:hypothetical protein BKA56DRAFT_688620 [Ilyonectria sp. MPI-CAGE-AT-0026]